MEFEDVSEEVDWEARRVAAAFGLVEWDEQGESCGDLFSSSRKQDFEVRCCIDNQARLFDLHIENVDDPTTIYCDVELQPEFYCVPCFGNPSYNELMARGLYRLGFDDPALSSQLPELNAHEKLELRLSMPCEFWPKTWQDLNNESE
jgi:hypothetical protein